MLLCFGSCRRGEGNGGDRSLDYMHVSSFDLGTVELGEEKGQKQTSFKVQDVYLFIQQSLFEPLLLGPFLSCSGFSSVLSMLV